MSTFKKQIITSAVALGFVGATQAATSVTLYGIVDVGYEFQKDRTSTGSFVTCPTTLGGAGCTTLAGWHSAVTHGTGASVPQPDITVPASVTFGWPISPPSTTTTTNHVVQKDGHKDTSRIGVKGQEDLGNGLSAIFKAEMRFYADTGSLQTQMADTYVGVKGSFGEVTVGRRVNINDDLFGYDSNAQEIDNRDTIMGGFFNNNMSYRGAFGGLTVGADVSTGEGNSAYTNAGGIPGGFGYNITGGRDQQYAVGAEYSFGAGAVAAGYQHDAVGKHAYGLGLKYKVGPVEMFARVLHSTQSVNGFYQAGPNTNMDKTHRETGWSAGLNYSITPNDILALSYSQLNETSNSSLYASNIRATSPYIVANVRDKTRALSVDYTHNLSKRTSIYAGATIDRTRTYGSMQFYNAAHLPSGAWEAPTFTSSKSLAFNVGLKHKF